MGRHTSCSMGKPLYNKRFLLSTLENDPEGWGLWKTVGPIASGLPWKGEAGKGALLMLRKKQHLHKRNSVWMEEGRFLLKGLSILCYNVCQRQPWAFSKTLKGTTAGSNATFVVWLPLLIDYHSIWHSVVGCFISWLSHWALVAFCQRLRQMPGLHMQQNKAAKSWHGIEIVPLQTAGCQFWMVP